MHCRSHYQTKKPLFKGGFIFNVIFLFAFAHRTNIRYKLVWCLIRETIPGF
jgi:hypothetical protein